MKIEKIKKRMERKGKKWIKRISVLVVIVILGFLFPNLLPEKVTDKAKSKLGDIHAKEVVSDISGVSEKTAGKIKKQLSEFVSNE